MFGCLPYRDASARDRTTSQRRPLSSRSASAGDGLQTSATSQRRITHLLRFFLKSRQIRPPTPAQSRKCRTPPPLRPPYAQSPSPPRFRPPPPPIPNTCPRCDPPPLPPLPLIQGKCTPPLAQGQMFPQIDNIKRHRPPEI